MICDLNNQVLPPYDFFVTDGGLCINLVFLKIWPLFQGQGDPNKYISRLNTDIVQFYLSFRFFWTFLHKTLVAPVNNCSTTSEGS